MNETYKLKAFTNEVKTFLISYDRCIHGIDVREYYYLLFMKSHVTSQLGYTVTSQALIQGIIVRVFDFGHEITASILIH